MLTLFEDKKIDLKDIEKTWIVDFLLLLIKNIRSFRQKQIINQQIEVYGELTQEWKEKIRLLCWTKKKDFRTVK